MTHGQKLKNTFGRFIGVSLTMQELYRQIEKFAVSDAPVLITGESGTGKEICAQSFHSYSDRNHQPFIPLNCAGLDGHMADSALFGHVKGAFTGAHRTRKGAIARAQGGTLFLDEVFDMPLLTQAKLLRFCQDYSYRKLGCDRLEQADIRLICATNKNLKKNLKANRFREDLYYRLNTIPVHMPPCASAGRMFSISRIFTYTHMQRRKIKLFVILATRHRNACYAILGRVISGNYKTFCNMSYRVMKGRLSQPICCPASLQRMLFYRKKTYSRKKPRLFCHSGKLKKMSSKTPSIYATATLPRRRPCLILRPPLFTAKNKAGKKMAKALPV